MLGPLEVDGTTGSPADFGLRERIVLIVLLLTPGRAVAADRLCDALWGEEPPVTARKVLQNLVLRIRKVVGASTIVTRPGGYVLMAEPGAIDAVRFERLVSLARSLVDDGDVLGAADAFLAAQQQWRGPPMPEISQWPFGRAHAARLDELRRCAAEDMVSAQLACGRHHDWVGEIEVMVADEPFREKRWELLALALYRDGRHADAMRAFQRARECLGEVGLDIGPDLRRLERSIIGHDLTIDIAPHLTMRRHTGRVGPAEEDCGGRLPLPPEVAAPTSIRFVGRAAEWQCLESAWRRAQAGQRSTVLVGGEAGAGKSRLVLEFARACHANGATVLYGACDDQLTLAYQPWIAVFEHVLRSLSPAELAQRVGSLADLLVMIPQMERLVTGLRRPTDLEPELELHRLLASAAELLAYAASRAPVVVVIDDLQWAGSQTLALLRHLARRADPGRLMVVGTFRDSANETGVPLAALLAEFRRFEGIERLHLSGFDRPTVAAFVARAADVAEGELGADLQEIASLLFERTQGNAFYVRELWQHLVSAGAVTNRGGGWFVRRAALKPTIPDSVREVVAARLTALSPPARSLLDIAAVAGARCECRVLAASAHGHRGDIGAALDELVTAGLLEMVDAPWLTYQFAHAMVRDTVEESISPAARAESHIRLAGAIEEIHATDLSPVFADLSRHYLAGASLGAVTNAVHYARLAAAQALGSFAYDEAIEQLTPALRLTAAGSDDRLDVLMDLGTARVRHGLHGAAREAFLEAFELARTLGLPTRVAQAAIGFEYAVHMPGMPGGPAAAIVSAALILLPAGETVLHLRLESSLARALALAGRGEEAAGRIDSVVKRAHQSGDLVSLSAALGAAASLAGDPLQVIAWCEELEAVASRLGDPWDLLFAETNKFRSLFVLGRLHEAAATLDRLRRAMSRGSFAFHRLVSHVNETLLAMAEGDFSRAEVMAEHARSVAAEEESEFGEGVYGLQMFVIRRDQGRLREVLPVVRIISQRSAADAGAWRPGLAALYAELEMLDEAQAQLDVLAPDGFGSVPRDSLWPVCASFLADACTATGDVERAAVVYGQMTAQAGRNLMAGMTVCVGPADRYLGRLADLLGREQRAGEHFRIALLLAESSGSPVWKAQVLFDLASRGLIRDPERSLDRAQSALVLASKHGMAGLESRCRRFIETNAPGLDLQAVSC